MAGVVAYMILWPMLMVVVCIGEWRPVRRRLNRIALRMPMFYS